MFSSISLPVDLWLGSGLVMATLFCAHFLCNSALRKRAETERRLNEVLAATGEGIWDWHIPSGRVIHNPQWHLLLHDHLEQLPGTVEAFAARLHPDDKEAVWKNLNRVLLGENKIYESEHRMIAVDGTIIWVRDRGQIVEYELTGKPVRMVGSFADITRHKLAELALRDNEQRLARVIDGSDQGFWEWNLQTNAFTVSSRFEEMLGFQAGEMDLSVENWGNCVHPDDYPLVRTSIRRHQAGEIPSHEVEMRCLTKSGEWCWILTRGRIVEWDAQGRPLLMSGTHTNISDKKTAAKEIDALAYYDPLTHLPNRRLMQDRLLQALIASIRHQRHGALIIIDLDNFKMLNESLGHDAGDCLLIAVAARLQASVRQGDTVARIGGDEFALILEDFDASETAALQVERVITKIQADLGRPYLLELSSREAGLHSHSYQCTSSMGVILFDHESPSPEALLKHADTALYQAKNAGRNTWRFFDPDMQAVIDARAKLENDLHQAIREDQFIVHYQAQVDAAGQLVGAEALIRWRHPERGMISPADFIPLAEETGLIIPLGEWVLHTACAQLAAWSRSPSTAHLTLAVNVSARQFSQPKFVERTLALIDSSGTPAERLKLELTESLLSDNTEHMIARMSSLRERGIRFSLDDFGTGYSSLSYLKRLPLNQLKIDQSFVRDVLIDNNDATIARTIVALGKSLGLNVIAEGVETAAQRDFLARHGCLIYQGYYFSRPVPLAEFEQLIQDAASQLKDWEYHDHPDYHI